MSYLISLGAGLIVGLLYWLVRVQSPAPPLIALAGLLGIVIGEHAIPFAQAQWRNHDAQTQSAPSVASNKPASDTGCNDEQ